MEELQKELNDIEKYVERTDKLPIDDLPLHTLTLKDKRKRLISMFTLAKTKFADNELASKIKNEFIKQINIFIKLADGTITEKPKKNVSNSKSSNNNNNNNDKNNDNNNNKILKKSEEKPMCPMGKDCNNTNAKHYYDLLHFQHPRSEDYIEQYLDSIPKELIVVENDDDDENKDDKPKQIRNDYTNKAAFRLSKLNNDNNNNNNNDSDDDYDIDNDVGGYKYRRRQRKLKEKQDEVITEDMRQQRLDFLLKKTQGYMRTLTRKIRQNFREANIKKQLEEKKDDKDIKKTVIKTNNNNNNEEISCNEVRGFLEGYDGGSIEQTKSLVGGTLKDYQKVGLRWLVSLNKMRLNGILADEMGLGKTVQAIALLAYIKDIDNSCGLHLIVAPLSTLSGWIHHFESWLPSLNIYLHRGPKEEREKKIK